MAQVPYSPVPDVTPTSEGAPSMRIQATGAAFGENVANAISSVGGDLDKVGNELWARAVAIKELDNHAVADKAYQDFVEQQGQLHENFNTLQGKDRVDAYPKYIQDTHELRDRMGQNLNPQAKQFYDANSRGQAGRMIFSGAVLAGEANKDFLIKNGEASLKLLEKQISDNPTDDTLYNDSIEKAKKTSNYLAGLHGMGQSSSYEDFTSKDAISKITRNRLISINQTDPDKALKMFEQLKGNMLEQDKDFTFGAIQGQNRSIGVANVAQATFSTMYDDTGKQIKSINQAEGEVRLKAQQIAPNDSVFVQRAVNQLRALNTQHYQADKMDDWQAGQQVRDYIAAHPEIRTEQQLRAVPEMAMILDNMNFKGRGIDTPGYIHRYLDSKFKEVNDEEFYRLRALARNDRNEFLNTDFTTRPLNQRQIDGLNVLRKQLIEKPGDDPHIKNAVLWMQQAHGTELQALGIDRRNQNNKDEYDKYEGAMWQAIDAWQGANQGRVPGFKDITETIGPAVIQKFTQPTWFGMSSEQVPEYKMDIPKDFRQEGEDRGRTEDQIRRDWNAFQFQKLFGPKVERGTKGDQPKPSPTSTKPQVPMSQ